MTEVAQVKGDIPWISVKPKDENNYMVNVQEKFNNDSWYQYYQISLL